MTSTLSFLSQVAAEMAEVESRLHAIGEENFPWLSHVVQYVLGSSGKRVRPAITLLVGKHYSYRSDFHIPMAGAVELLHTATLVHDDTVDHASLRRGRPTVNAQFGHEVAVLLGDYLFATSAEWVCSTGNVRVIQLFSRTLRLLSSGEMRELYAAYDWSQGRDMYWERVLRKTASLFDTAAQAGAILGGAPEAEIEALHQYGTNLGVAFQVVDDILDFEGKATEVGKPVGNDLLQGIMTLPAILFLERYASGAQAFDKVGRDHDEEAVRRAIALVRESPAIADSYKVAEEYCEKARRALDPLAASPFKRALREIADYVMARDR
ncbi:MAG: polyprenyl synthetase family protein [Chloroflexi bacterium]|nr:polyprenyl synthetase family protein [Chloroflexota bacterium]